MASDSTHFSGLASRYATAVFELALDEKALDGLETDLASLKKLLETSPELSRLVKAPVVSRDEQAKAMEAVLKAAGATSLTRNLVLLLTAKRRLFILSDVINAFEAMVSRHKGEVTASVVSARPLSADETNELKAALKSKLGRDPKLNTSVDPKLLGGLRLKVGSRMIDSSLRTKLDSLARAMKGN